MRLHRYALMCLLVYLLCPSTGSAQEQAANSAANAALQYWQAFAFLPSLDEQQEKLVEQWNTVPLDAAVDRLIADSQTSLSYLHRGASIEHCDWGLDYNGGMSLLLPHLSKARTLSRLAALRARVAFERGNHKAAMSDARALMALGRHIGRDPLLISILVAISLEDMAIDVIAPHVPQLKIPHADAVAAFQSLPRAAQIQQTIAIEKRYMAGWAIDQLKAAEQRQSGSGLALARQWFEGGKFPEGLEQQVKSTDDFVRLTAELYPLYDQLAEIVALPNAEFDARYPAFMQKAQADNPLAALFLPAFNKSLAKYNRHQARIEMLLAAFAVVEGGPQKLKGIQDPFGDGAFAHRELDQGFELQSALVVDGQAVKLRIGKP